MHPNWPIPSRWLGTASAGAAQAASGGGRSAFPQALPAGCPPPSDTGRRGCPPAGPAPPSLNMALENGHARRASSFLIFSPPYKPVSLIVQQGLSEVSSLADSYAYDCPNVMRLGGRMLCDWLPELRANTHQAFQSQDFSVVDHPGSSSNCIRTSRVQTSILRIIPDHSSGCRRCRRECRIPPVLLSVSSGLSVGFAPAYSLHPPPL